MSLLSDIRSNTSNARRKVQQDILVLVHHLLSARVTIIWALKVNYGNDIIIHLAGHLISEETILFGQINCKQRMQDLQRSALKNGDGS